MYKALLQCVVSSCSATVTNKIQEEHQQVIEEKDNQIQALEFTNDEHQQKILKLNK